MKTSKDQNLTRRRFLAQTMLLAAAPIITPKALPERRILRRLDERMRLGFIGLGGTGMGHLELLKGKAVAVCDVDQARLAHAAAAVGRSLRTVGDYRQVLDMPEVDAVVIATPDHWHAMQVLDACRAGKDVYVEAPLCSTIAEGQILVDAARRMGRVVQVGLPLQSSPAVDALHTHLRQGALGTVTEVTCWHLPNPTGGDPSKDGPAPDTLDWDRWLGPAAWRPYNPDRCHYNFRWIMDFGGGYLHQQGVAMFDLVLSGLDLPLTAPVRVTATGTPSAVGLWDNPATLSVRYEFSNPNFLLRWMQPAQPPRAEANGLTFHGEQGELTVNGVEENRLRFSAPIHAESPDAQSLQQAHFDDWFEAIRTRRQPAATLDTGFRAVTLCILGNLAYRLGRTLTWDPATGRFVNDPQADRLLARPGRGQWRI